MGAAGGALGDAALGDAAVVVVGAGPVGCTVALLLAGFGVPVTLLERHAAPPGSPRAVHLDDEVARTLARVGVGAEFVARSRPGSGLRLLDARHRVMAEFRREQRAGEHGFPQANMFHQPDLEDLLFDRIRRQPLVRFCRGAEVTSLGEFGARTSLGEFGGRFVLGCDGANSTVRDLAGIGLDDLGFTERWLIVDVRAPAGLDTWDGVEQVCDPARAVTFMHVTGDRYRWEFRLRDGEDSADLGSPQILGRLLQPWTGRADLAGLEIVRTASYTFRARLASRFRAGPVFLLGDAAHLTPPFIGQGLAAGLRDADNLAWKLAYVLGGQAGPDLLDSYDAERRPHARAMIKKAVLAGWAMTGGQDRAAAVRRVALAAAVRSEHVRRAMDATATPRLKAGAVASGRSIRVRAVRVRPVRVPASLRPGGLIANPLVRAGGGPPVRLDEILAGRAAVVTARKPSAGLVDYCRGNGLVLARVSGDSGAAGASGRPDAGAGWIEVRLADGQDTGLRALTADLGLAVVVRPDRVIASAETGGRLPLLPWSWQASPAS